MVRITCPLVFVCALAAVPVAAQEQVAPIEALVLPAEAGSYELQVLPAKAGSRRKSTRPAALVPLYASFGALQALDYASTTRALQSGNAREANPMMSGIVGNRAAFVAVKAAATAGVIYAGERMWKKNRVAAVIFVAALNGAMTAVVARNYSVR